MRTVLSYVGVIVGIILFLMAAYWLMNPLPFLFATGLVLGVLYFFALYTNRKDNSRSGQTNITLSRRLSVCMLLILFGVSLKVLKDYQLPKSESAYFTNIDHHVIRNYGIGYQNSLELFAAADDSVHGIWPSPSGSFLIKEVDSSSANFVFKDFFLPVFGVTQNKKSFFDWLMGSSRNTVRLLNPVYKEPVQDGFEIRDALTSITFTKVVVGKKDGNNVYDLKVVFATRDRFLLDTAVMPASAFVDSAYAEGLVLNKGLDLKSVFHHVIKKPATANMVMQWLDRYSKCYLFNDATAANTPQLLFFPSYDFYEAGRVSLNGQALQAQLSAQATFKFSGQFYVGFENERKKYTIRKLTTEEEHFTSKAKYALLFKEVAYFPFKSSEPDRLSMGKDMLRFLKCNYRQLTYNEIREGFLFHDDTKQNAYTDFDAILKYSADPAGSKLNPELVAGGGASITQDGKLGISSSNGEVSWLFSIEDFANNAYDLAHLSKYLAILVLAMLALVIFKPGINIIYLETPVLMIVYSLMVFRFLLLWRIATFPPLNGISNNEFDTLLNFDLREFKFLPISFPTSLFIVLVGLGTIFMYRSKRVGALNTFSLYQESRQFINAHPVWFHAGLLVVSAACQRLHIEWLTRVLSIALPLASYFLCCYIVVKKETRYNEKQPSLNNKYLYKVYRFFAYWIESPVFFLSLFTLGYLFIFDAGFGILFLFFLLFKNILLAFNRRPAASFANSRARFISPAGYRIFGGIFLAVYLIAITYKKTFYYLLEYKIVLVEGVLLLTATAVYLLWYPVKQWQKTAKNVTTWSLIGLTVLLIVPTFLQDYVNNKIDDKTRLVKYRTTILTDPVENMLLNYRYNSSKEQKIIETAQGQWFINIYLNAGHDKRLINLREHFNKGVDYSTQTRDVVMPRYIIAEFGGRMQWILLLAFILPLVLFFLRYQLAADRKSYFHVGSYTGAMAVVLLVTLAVFVWLTSTNRFVFFGQDYPFLSLTSKVSTLLPMILVVALLTSNPKLRSIQRNDISVVITRWVGFIIIIGIAIWVSGRSNLISEERFKVDFTKVLNRVDSINNLLGTIQAESAKGYQLSASLLKDHPEKFMHNVKQLLDTLYQYEKFNDIYSHSTIYERSMLDSLRLNPAFGFKVSSPLHVKYDGGRDLVSLTFNQHFHLEQPPYNIKKVWKGDIEEDARLVTEQNVPRAFGSAQRKIIVVPASFLPPGEGPVALLYLNSDNNNDECQIYNKKDEQIKLYKHEFAVARLMADDIVFFYNKNAGKITPWTMYGNKHYFAYSMTINGRQRHIYPMGDLLFWARDWKDANTKYYETIKDFQRSSTLSLDYDLNRRVSQYLQQNLRAIKKEEPELSFSVIAADGNGQIRLLSDYVAQREIIDPNNEAKVAQKKSEQYFNVDSRAERLQWGNLNLLHLNLGPGSSIKPIVAAAVTAGLKAEWQQLQYKTSEDTLIGNSLYTKYYAGLKLTGKGWKIGEAGNSTNHDANFIQYLSKSNNWYHSLIVFLGAYEKEAFLKNGNYSLTNQLSQTSNGNNSRRFPIMALGGSTYYFHDPEGWPLTNQHDEARPSYFGSSTSLLANGLRKNFFLQINPSNRYNSVAPRDSISAVMPDTITNKNIWSSPEASFFFQDKRTAANLVENFNRGLRNPTLGGDPFIITPLGMLELYGKMASYNRLYKVTIDKPKRNTRSNFDADVTWNGAYPAFMTTNIYEGMRAAVTSGTAAPLTGGQFNYNGYYLYAKTGTIGNSDDENSKRLALIITKEPFNNDNLSSNAFYVIYFTIGHAFENDDANKNWFWPIYKKVLDEVMRSNSFKTFMK